MTDEELIARLRMVTGFIRFETGDRVAASICLSEEAADRIEQLAKERDEALEWLSASQGYIADAVFALDKQEKAEARAERLEAAMIQMRDDKTGFRHAVHFRRFITAALTTEADNG